MAQRLKDKICVVTGSSSGLGRAIALGYAREGASVVCADLRPQARAEVEAEVGVSTDELIRNEHGEKRAVFVKTDVSRSDEFENLIARTVEAYGRIDV